MIYLFKEDLFVVVLFNCICKNLVGLVNKLVVFVIGEYFLVLKGLLDVSIIDLYVG